MSKVRLKAALAVVLAVFAIAGGALVVKGIHEISRTYIVAYFANSNGIYVGDEVRILGVPVGKIDKIEPQMDRVKISLWVEQKYAVPADVKAAVLSPSLVTSRAIQLTPAYTGGPALKDNAVIPLARTAVPVEWDDFRAQLEKLTNSMQPTQPGGVSPFGALINTTADNLRGQGANIHDMVVKLSQALSALGDHSDDIFSTVKNLSVLVSVLHDNAGLLEQLNRNLSAVSALVASDPDSVGHAVHDLNAAVGDVTNFLTENRDTVGTTTDRLASISTALVQSIDDIKQILHSGPTAYQNFLNIYEPAHGSLVAAPTIAELANPIQFLCGAIQAASRLGAEQSAKLCVQYLAPIMKNRQYNFLPFGENILVGPKARPNELTYSEDWLRPDYVPPGTAPAPAPPVAAPPPGPPPVGAPAPVDAPLPAAALGGAPSNPADGLLGMMTPPGPRS
ncbi:virulence factor Mce family protein [Mycobacterium sp. Aquia_216]|uniref:virulence factor Mce family protein n=1 Tax=Mycobacterium sp. Aquia_216 TaxID=2991729 RepID=UPI00227CBF5F|nr:virulence factor Mce family protein [Mycobacterium sp. Aquia_216]WAJ44323.1 virulence factor Mce family protein [Mycobacterium sp. Aquia_216]